MIIETKHNIWDTVYLLKDNRVLDATIQEVEAKVSRENVIVKYLVFISHTGYTYTYSEAQLFKTKQELLEAL